jgi:hypothetical protein
MESNEEPNLDILHELLDDFINLGIDDLSNEVYTKEFKKEKKELYKLYKIEKKRLKKGYPKFMKKFNRKPAYDFKKYYLQLKIGDSEIRDCMIENFVNDIITMLLISDDINYIHKFSREKWDNLTIIFDENPDTFKNKSQIHDFLNNKLKTFIESYSEIYDSLKSKFTNPNENPLFS